MEIAIILAENTNKLRVLKILRERILWYRAVVAVEGAVAVVALESCAILQASVTCEALLLYEVLQSSANVDPAVLFLIILDILVILQALLMEIYAVIWRFWIQCFLEGECEVRVAFF